MGLDAVELIMTVEERFGIDIPDAEARHLDTPRKLIDCVSAKVRGDERRCVSQRSFYRVRRVLVAATGLERSEVSPRTTLESIIPRAQRRSLWPKLAGLLGAKRELQRPAWLSFALIVGAIAVGVALERTRGGAVALLAVAGSALVATLLTERAAMRLAGTVGDLALEAIPRLVFEDQLEQRASGWTRAEVAETIRVAIREQLGVGAFSDDASFKSLGLD
ncbi:MAG: acyl carrier protein [Archangium sp.]|nr:acyl carrier protein [Archangium sp.]